MSSSEILRFTLPSSPDSLAAFQQLRNDVASHDDIKAQYFGYVLPNEGFPPKLKDQMCWVIQWPEKTSIGTRGSILSQLEKLAGDEPKSLILNIQDSDPKELSGGLQAPVCQFAIIGLIDSAPLSSPELQTSLHKTFTDCYLAQGFTGGGWSFALNTNEYNGVQPGSAEVVKEENKRLACYVLGWESIEAHHAFATTPLFDEEMDKLKPWFGPNSGTWYARFEKHI